jgi:hypothetical protein
LEECPSRSVRLAYMIAMAHQCGTLEECQSMVDGLTDDYDVRDCVWNIVDIAEMPMVGEEITETRESAFAYTTDAGETVELDLLKTTDRKPREVKRYLLVLHGTRVIACGARLSIGEEVALETIATVGAHRRGLASFLLDEVKKDFPQVAYKPPFSRQGFIFLIRSEGFEGLRDFFEWAQNQERWP